MLIEKVLRIVLGEWLGWEWACSWEALGLESMLSGLSFQEATRQDFCLHSTPVFVLPVPICYIRLVVRANRKRKKYTGFISVFLCFEKDGDYNLSAIAVDKKMSLDMRLHVYIHTMLHWTSPHHLSFTKFFLVQKVLQRNSIKILLMFSI